MKATEGRPVRGRRSASPIRVDEAQTVPSYLQRYATELEAWHAQRRAVRGRKS
jgi:hypothetical protein